MMQVAGAIAIFVAVGHGWMGDQALRQQPLTAEMRNFIRAAYQFGTAGWLAVGVLMLASNGLGVNDRQTLGLVAIALFGFAALTNAWFTRGRHPGWVLLAVTCVLTGLSL